MVRTRLGQPFESSHLVDQDSLAAAGIAIRRAPESFGIDTAHHSSNSDRRFSTEETADDDVDTNARDYHSEYNRQGSLLPRQPRGNLAAEKTAGDAAQHKHGDQPPVD